MSMICILREVDELKLKKFTLEPEEVIHYIESTDPNELDLHKEWHSLHYLLTGTAWDGDEPYCYLVKGGEEIGDDLGYGPARVLKPNQVKSFCDALSKVSAEDLKKRYKPEQMEEEEIYAFNSGEGLKSISDSFNKLRKYVKEINDKNQGLMIYLT
jgi:hypothetical protein